MPRQPHRQCIIHPYILDIIDTASPLSYNRAAVPPLALQAVAAPGSCDTTGPWGRGYGRLLSMPCVDTARPVPFPVMPSLPGPSRFLARPQLPIRYAPLP
jgi:hypothetical protein